MANVLTAATRTATSTLGVVTSSAQALEVVATAAATYASTLTMHAEHYRERTAIGMIADKEDALERRFHQKAVDDAAFYEDLDKQLDGNPRLKTHYEASLARYRTAYAEYKGTNNITKIAAE
jgi:hypothetical protein